MRRPREGGRLLPAPSRLARLTRGDTLAGVTLVLLVLSIAIYVAGCVLLAWEGRRDVAVLLAAVGGVGLSVFTMP